MPRLIVKGTGGKNPLPNYPPPRVPGPRQAAQRLNVVIRWSGMDKLLGALVYVLDDPNWKRIDPKVRRRLERAVTGLRGKSERVRG